VQGARDTSARRGYDPSVAATLDMRPAHGDGVIAQSAGEGTVLLHLETGKYYSLDAVGSRVWALCDGRRTGHEIAHALAGAYAGTPPNEIRDDVAELLAELDREHLVRGG
jgi:hypothetical protein